MIIAVEGMDGVGKTTICKYIEERFNFIYIDKPTKYLFEDNQGKINYEKFYQTLDRIYELDEASRTIFFGKGNLIAVTKYPEKDIVIDRHLVSNYYWNGSKKLYNYYDELIKTCGKPDITIYLYASPKERYKRLKERNQNDLDLSDQTVFEDELEKVLEFLNDFNLEYKIIDTNNKSIEDVCHEVENIIKVKKKIHK